MKSKSESANCSLRSKVKVAIIGAGAMGNSHCRRICDIETLELVAVCDTDKVKADVAAAKNNCVAFYDHTALLNKKCCDAVIIVTPHYSHTTIGIDALKAGVHVLVEKPISVHKADCQRLIKAYTNKKMVFAAMFNQRTNPCYRKVKQLIDEGELGALMRVSWIITDWFRPQSYYDNGGWRATWAGEGGGVLINQCPHQLDLLQWLCGMPSRVSAHCAIGKYHNIEVEDEVTAYLEYPNGATGIFITSTGEAPGTNRLEITGSKGKIVVENNTIKFTRNEKSCDEFSRISLKAFDKPEVWNVEIPVCGAGGQHEEILKNFANTILHKEKLLAPAVEGIHSVELGNAMMLSSVKGRPVDLPLDGSAYERMLKKLIKGSRYIKQVKEADISGFDQSF
jgi:predicted dehydrogenase